MKISRRWFNDKFYSLLFCNKRYLILYGSRGSSKSEFVAQYCILKSLEDGYFRLTYSRKNSEHIRDSQFSLLKKWIRIWELEHLFTIYEATMKIKCNINENMMIAKGVNDSEKVKSIDEPSHIWLEEITEFEQVDFETLNNGLRTNKTQVQAIATFNPISEKHWVRNFFFDPKDNTKPNPVFGDSIIVHHSTFWDNRFIDREAYNTTLTISCGGDENRYNVNAKGLWGIEDKQKKFAWAFEDSKHVQPAKDDPELVRWSSDHITWLTFDFNVNPMTCTVIQHYDEVIRGIECIRLENSNTWEMCRVVLSKYPDAIFKVTGDATGYNRNTMAPDNVTNYQIIQQVLSLNDNQIVVPVRNPNIEDNQILVNAVLGNYECYFSELCQPLIYDLTYVEMNEKKEIIKDRTSSKKYADFLDNFRYFVNVEFDLGFIRTLKKVA